MRYLLFLHRVLGAVCLFLFVGGWGGEVLKYGFGLHDAPFVFVCLVYVGLTLFPWRYKEVAVGSSIGLITGFLFSLFLTKIGIIFLLVVPSPCRMLFYRSNLLLVLSGIFTWAACYRSLDNVKLFVSTFCSFMIVTLFLQGLRLL